VMLDGGGSSTFMLGPYTLNTPTDGRQRVVGSHLGILYRDTRDPACVVDNGRFCDDNQLQTCTGGDLSATGDCAAYGLTCAEDGDWAFCVDPRCPDADGNGGVCTGSSTLQSCTDGSFGEGDCAYFGMVCGDEGGANAMCIDARCPDGPEGGVCTTGTTLASCSAGVYAESDCSASGLVCEAGACVAANDTGSDHDSAVDPDPDRGDSGGDGDMASTDDGGSSDGPGAVTPWGGCACASDGAQRGVGPWTFPALAVVIRLAALLRRRPRAMRRDVA